MATDYGRGDKRENRSRCYQHQVGMGVSGPVPIDETDDTVSAAMAVYTLYVDAVTTWLEETLRSFWELE